MRFSPAETARYVAWSRNDHSNSRFDRKSYGDGKVALFSVVSTVKMSSLSARNFPMRDAEWWSAERSGCMYDFESRSVGHVVVVTQRAVRPESDGNRLVAAVHRHEVDVRVDEEVGLHRALAQLDLFAAIGRTDERDVVGVLGVEVPQPVGPEGAEHALADHPLDLACGHPPVERVRGDDLDVVDAGFRRERQDALEDHLPRIGTSHRRQRQRDVVERDRQSHPRTELRAQRVGVLRMLERVRDRLFGMRQCFHRLRGIHDAAAARQLLETEPFAGVEQHRR